MGAEALVFSAFTVWKVGIGEEALSVRRLVGETAEVARWVDGVDG